MGHYELVLDFLQRYTHDHAQNLRGKPIVIWGAVHFGRLAYLALIELGLACKCFIDSGTKKIGGDLLGLPVLAPETILDGDDNPYFVIVAAALDDEIRSRLADARGNDDSYLMMCSEIKAERSDNSRAGSETRVVTDKPVARGVQPEPGSNSFRISPAWRPVQK